jgi:hypothetical protein
MKKLLAAFALLALSFTPAHAGGVHAKVEGPAKDGVTYTVRALACSPEIQLEPWAHAEGLVDGKRQAVLLRLEPTSEHGVYTFQRAWPEKGDWMLRVNLGAPPAPATVTSLSRDGRVKDNQLFWKTDGSPECQKALIKIAKSQGITLDDGC